MASNSPASAQSLDGPLVRAGSATVDGLGTTSVTVRQTTDRAVIDWRRFSIDSGSSIVFAQPGTSSITLNRVSGGEASRIDGTIGANGQVWLLNPNGVLIGTGGRVTVNGLLATTHAISDADFLDGTYRFDGSDASGSVVNRGTIVADNGYAVLAGNQVENSGLIQARLGQVVLGAGGGYALDIAGDKLLSFAVTAPVPLVAGSAARIENTGTLSAQGGRVVLSARAASDVVGSVINTTSLIDATAARVDAGTIVLDGGEAGQVFAGGTLDASGKAAGQRGGTIQVFGDTVVVGANARVDASGAAGGGTINVGGGWQGAVIDGHASAVRAAVAPGATLDSSATDHGDGGEITLWSDVHNAASQTYASGTFLARGGINGGNGGRIETSGHYLDAARATGSASAPSGRAGTWLFDPYDVEIVASTPLPGIVNPGFENGLVGWTVVGTGGSADVVTSATAAGRGSRPGFIDPGGVVYTSQISSGGNFLLASGGDNGSNNGVTQTFSGTANDAFTMYGLFLGKDRASSNDYVFVRLALPDGTSQALYLRNSSGVGDFGTSPWESVRYTLPQTGTYTIFATSTNLSDSLMPSQLGFEIGAALNSTAGTFTSSGFGQTWTPSGAGSRVDVAQITGLLNAGTNVQITTGSAGGGDAGNITVNAAITKTAGGDATLRLDATNAIIVNQAIGSTAGALNVTLNAGAGGIAFNNTIATNGGTLTLASSGRATQTAALSAAALVLNGAGGPYTLSNTANSFGTIGGTAGEAVIASAGPTTVADLTVSGTVIVSSDSAITLAGTNSFSTASGGGTIVTPGAITLAAGSHTTTGQLLAVQAGTNFVNRAGTDAILTTGGGRWLVYSQGPASDTFGGLASGNLAIWNQVPATLPPGAVPAGNRYIFAQSPTLTVTADSLFKTYGDMLGGSARGFAVTGLVDAASYGNVFRQDALSGTPLISSAGDDARANVGRYRLDIAQGSLVAPQGYGLVLANGSLQVDPRRLVLAATSATRTYDGTATSNDAPTATGLVNGDQVGNLAQSFDSRNAGTRTLLINAGYTVTDGNGGRNYAIVEQTATGAITPRLLTAALIGSTAKLYDGTLFAALTAGNYTLSGMIAGDAVALTTPASGSYADRNAGTGLRVSASGLTLSGTNAGNYSVNTMASGSIGTITPRPLSATLTGSVTKTYDGTTTATLASGNYLLSGFVAGEGAGVSATAGRYATPDPGGNILVSSTLGTGDFAANVGTLLGNYTLPVGTVSGRVGLITPQIVVPVVTSPAVPPPSAIATTIATILPPATATPTVSATAVSAAPAVPGASPVATGGADVAASPPSPIADVKPDTPLDPADADDPILASVEPAPGRAAAGSGRRESLTTVISPGLLSEQRALPPRAEGVPGIDDAFSGSGSIF